MTIESQSTAVVSDDEGAEDHNGKAHIYVDEAGAPVQEAPENDLPAFITIRRTSLNYVVIAVVFLLLGLFIGAFTTSRIEQADRAWISDAVAEAFDAQAETLAGLVAAARPPSLDDSTSRFELTSGGEFFMGGAEALVEIVEFSDFNCGFCGRFHRETFGPLMETYGDSIRFVYRDFPILGDSSTVAALAARCAGEQGQFWEYHDLLFNNQGTFAVVGTFAQFADQLGLDVDEFNTCVDEQHYLEPVITDVREAQSLGIRGTPAFFVNGRPISGAQPLQVFVNIINEELDANDIDSSTFSLPLPETGDAPDAAS